MRKIPLFLLAFLTAGCLSAKSDNSKVLARFEGGEITESEFLQKVAALPKAVREAAFGRKKELIEDIASEHFLLKEAKKRGLDKDREVQNLIEAAQKKILIARLVQKEVDDRIGVDAQEIAKYYELNQQEFMTPVLLRASHILVKTEEEANEIKASLDAGADFEETARQRSADATAIRGGDLGFFQKGQFVPEFEEAVFRMKKGEISAPVKSSFGYHIIKLSDRVEPRLRELKSVKNIVEERLFREKRSRAFKELVEKLKGNTKIDIDQAVLDQVSLGDAKL